MTNVLLNRRTWVYHYLKDDDLTACGKPITQNTLAPTWTYADDHANTCPHCGHVPEIEVQDWSRMEEWNDGQLDDSELVPEDQIILRVGERITSETGRHGLLGVIRLCGSCARTNA